MAASPGELAVRRVRLYERETPLQTEHRPNNDMRPQQGGQGRRRRSRRRHNFGQHQAVYHEQFPQQETLPPMLTAAQLAEKTKTELVELAKELEIEIPAPAKLKKDDIAALIVQAQTARSGLEMASGILDVLPEGYGFLRRGGYVIGNEDIYVSQSQIRRFELRRGDMVEGQVRRPKESEKYFGLIRVDKVNGFDPEAIKGRAVFEKGTPIFPEERFKLENRS